MRFIQCLVLLLLLTPLTWAATTSTYDLRSTDTASVVNKVQTAATVDSTENIIVVQVGLKPRTVTFVSTSAWYYRSSASGANFPVAANQSLTLEFGQTTTFYHVRQSADGTMNVLVLK